ncbi:MAG: hypothetical protein QM723_02555 [Myxococcaceae bacterium]
MKTRKLLPAALAFAACTSTSGTDSGSCPHPDSGDAGTVRCTCEAYMDAPAMPIKYMECCDSDIGNPCGICCYNPRDADGGRMYEPDSGTPVCYC